jgi:type IV pilus assembly protein PilM
MVFGKRDHLVGLDIGSAFIKVAELKVSKKGKVLQKFGMAPVPSGSIVEGRIADMAGLADTIRSLFKAQKIKEKNVAISTGGHSVVIKTISTAKVPDKELHQSIRSEAEQYIPYDIDDVNIDYQILGESEFSPDQINVLLVAVKKDLVAEYMDLIKMAGLNPTIIDVDTFALQNVYEILPDTDPEEVTLLVDVGASKTSLNILKDNSSMMMRDMMIGVNQVLDEIAERFGIDLDRAAKVLEGEEQNGADEQALADICQSAATGWCAEICEVAHTFESGSNEMRLEKVLLSGGGSFLPALSQSLEAELDIPVAKIQPFSGIITDPKRFPEETLEKTGVQAAIALGLSLRRVDDK